MELPNPCSFEVSWDISTCSCAASACGPSMNAHPNTVRKLLGVVNSMALQLPKLQKKEKGIERTGSFWGHSGDFIDHV